MLFSPYQGYTFNPDAITEIFRTEESNPDFSVRLRGVDADDSPNIDANALKRLIVASAPVVPAQGDASALYVSFDQWGLPVIVDRPIVAWRILPEGPQAIIAFEPKQEKPAAYLTPHGMILLPTGEALRPQVWGARLMLEEAKRDGRLLDAPVIAASDDPLSA